MLTEHEISPWRDAAHAAFAATGIVITEAEAAALEFADFGLADFMRTGLIILTYVNTARVCAKELVLLPGQTCPEHRHPVILDYSGKEETFRCRSGIVYLYVAGRDTPAPSVRPPAGDERYYTVRQEIILRPGEQYTLAPDTLHWFQAGPDGAVVSEFSTTSLDGGDHFTDPRIRRLP
jgi:D-lyxose ketol-isomerase